MFTLSLSPALALALALALTAPTAFAAQALPEEEIVIQGERIGVRARHYVDQLLAAPIHAQFGAYSDPICAKVIGMPANLAQEVVTRIERVARESKIDVAAAGCFPNLMVVVVDDKRAFIEGLRKSDPAYLYGISLAERRRLSDSGTSYAAWQIRELVGGDGMPLRVDQDGVARLFTPTPASRLRKNVRPRVLGSVIVLEKAALTDMTTLQVADFALVRAMMPAASSGRTPPESSVLSLFNPGVTAVDGPQSLTSWDLAFLKSLRAMPLDQSASAQRNVIRMQMVREIARTAQQ